MGLQSTATFDEKISAAKSVICPAEEFWHGCHTDSVWLVMMTNQEGDEP
jgi:hypothetical protein